MVVVISESEWVEMTPEEQEQIREVRPWDLLSPDARVHREIAEARYTICQTCPHFHPIVKVCGECGCLMKVKTHLAEAWCPIGKWGAVRVRDDA